MNIQAIWRFCYARLLVPLVSLVLPLIARKNQNLRDGLDGRTGLWQRLQEQLATRDPKQPLLWFHVASAGEFLQVQPVLERCLQQGLQCALTFTSVNGYKWIQRTTFPEGREPIVKEYLPHDTVGNISKM